MPAGNKYVTVITPKDYREKELNDREEKINYCEKKKNNRAEAGRFGAIRFRFGAIRIRLGAIKFCLVQVCGNQIVARGVGEATRCADLMFCHMFLITNHAR